MSIPLVVTGGFGNGALSGTIPAVVVDGFSLEQQVATTQSDPLATVLLADANVTNLLRVNRIEQQGHVNVDADNTPWIGIYRSEFVLAAKRLGDIRDWENEEKIQVVIQATSYKSGADCEQRLDDLLAEVVESIEADKTIGGSVENITEMKVNYEYDYNDRESIHFQTAILELNTIAAKVYS